MRNNRPGSIQSVVHAAIEVGGGFDAVARDLAVSVSSVYRATGEDCDRPGGLGVNYLDRMGRIDRTTAEPVARHFSALAGGFFHPLPDGADANTEIAALAASFADVLRDHADAHSSRSPDPSGYTQSEAALVVADMDRLIATAARLRAAAMEKAGS